MRDASQRGIAADDGANHHRDGEFPARCCWRSLMILVLAIIVAFILRVIIRRSLQRIQFDQHMERVGVFRVNEWSPARSPAR